MRFLLLLLCVSGCDLIFLDAPSDSGICGPYAAPTEVSIDPALGPLEQFSPNGDRALARTIEAVPKLKALKFDGTMWVADPAFQGNLDTLRTGQLLTYGQLSFENHMFAAQRSAANMNFSVYEYTFNANAWSTDNTVVGYGTNEAVLPGGTLVTGADTMNDKYSYHVTTHHAAEPIGKGYLEVEVRLQNMNWQSEKVSGRLSTDAINQVHEVQQGAIAIGRNMKPTLIYAAKLAGSAGDTDLYVSEKVSGSFVPGVGLRELSSDQDELDPYTNADCSMIYFRRGEKIFQARAQGQ